MNAAFEGLGLVELIDLLEEAPEPPPIPLTPQTPGWIVLGIAVVLGLGILLRWAVRRHRANSYRRAALEELDQAVGEAAAVAGVLRRTALVAFPRSEVATLAGGDWLAFLDRTFPGSGFSDGAGRVLASAPYRQEQIDPEAAVLARSWIQTHRRDAEAQ